MQENSDVHPCIVYWKQRVLFLVLKWPMNEHCTLTPPTKVRKNAAFVVETNLITISVFQKVIRNQKCLLVLFSNQSFLIS